MKVARLPGGAPSSSSPPCPPCHHAPPAASEDRPVANTRISAQAPAPGGGHAPDALRGYGTSNSRQPCLGEPGALMSGQHVCCPDSSSVDAGSLGHRLGLGVLPNVTSTPGSPAKPVPLPRFWNWGGSHLVHHSLGDDAAEVGLTRPPPVDAMGRKQ